NARQHEQEAQIVADAGKLGAVTIATNMAGRGTDIKLGGNVEFKVMEAITADPHLHPDEVRARVEADHKADEEAVKAILREVSIKQEDKQEFASQVWSALTRDQRKKLGISNYAITIGVVSNVLQSELRGSALARAENLYAYRYDSYEIYRASAGAYFWEGATSVFDLSSTSSKVGTGLVTASLLASLRIAPQLTSLVGGLVCTGIAVYEGVRVVKNLVDIARSKSDAEKKQNYFELGEASAMLVSSIPLALPGWLTVTKRWSQFRNIGRFFPAFT
ncbi:MAG: hypothetical protein Q7S68_05675, partial [Deltaproteobacteria bacterium]|nr:hypothetical protein [Deltaproteobacteria bacterium]